MPDLYATLGVRRNSKPETINRRFRDLAKRSHPDHHPGDAEAGAKFKEIAEAFEVLNDPDKRAEYDRTGELPKRCIDTVRTQAIALLSKILHALIQQAVANGQDPSERELVAELRKSISGTIAEIKKIITQLEKAHEAIADAASRFTSKDDLLTKIARAQLVDVENTLKINREQAAIHAEALKLIEDATFNAKARKLTPSKPMAWTVVNAR